MIAAMTAILYPVAPHAEAALARPNGRAAREREAATLAGEAVAFTAEATGPAFATRDAALDAYAGRVEDDRPGRAATLAPEDRYCRLVEVVVGGAAQRPKTLLEPVNRDGRRWPEPVHPPRTVWRLSVSYWRIATAERPLEAPQARQARRRAGSGGLDSDTLRVMARQPLRPVKPQQPLDIGLFERRLPESPHIIVPDE
jgi:hypothetical protein